MKRLVGRVPPMTKLQSLEAYLESWLPHAVSSPLSKSKIRQLVSAGAVFVNRHREKNPKSPIRAGAVIEVYYDETKMTRSLTQVDDFKVCSHHILFENDDLIALNKPFGIPTQPTVDPHRANLYDALIAYRKEVAQRSPSSAVDATYVGLHHRLDKDTSGVVLFTKKKEANLELAQLFSERKIQKRYYAFVWRSAQHSSIAPLNKGDTFRVENHLGKLKAPAQRIARYGAVSSGGDYALTEFKVLEVYPQFYGLEASPKTGRTHQIRVHCSELGLPILGDPLYFPQHIFPMISVPRLMLHAFCLQFEWKGQSLKIEAEIPQDFLQLLK